MSRFIVATNDMGIPTAYLPLPFFSRLAERFSTEALSAVYHHDTNHVRVNFPGLDTLSVQRHLDALTATAAPTSAGLATWPGLHSAPPNSLHHSDGTCPATDADTGDVDSPSTASILSRLRPILDTLTPARQSRLTQLVVDLQAALAAERLCLHAFFEASPDALASTDPAGIIQHANPALCHLLQTDAADLEGKSLLIFFSQRSQSPILQRLRLLRTGLSEQEPFTAMDAQLTLPDATQCSVFIRIIAITAPRSPLATIRWLIRGVCS